MSIKIISIALLVASTLLGCASSNFKVGNDFASQHVPKIVKGKTTTEELVQLFGQPFSKTVVSATDEKWLYHYVSTSSTAQSYIVTMDVETSTFQKTLDLFISNGVVVNFTHTQGFNPSSVTVN